MSTDAKTGTPGGTSDGAGPRMTLDQAKRAWSKIKEFTVEFGDESCRTQSITTLKQMDVRGAWSVATIMQRPEGARTSIGEAMGQMPSTPGMRLTVFPAKMEAELFDPLEDDTELLKRIQAVLRKSRRISGEISAVPKTHFKLNPDTLKTLCLELLRKKENRQLKPLKGSVLPTEEQMAELPGHELNDPWNSSSRIPKYKHQVDAWERSIDRAPN